MLITSLLGVPSPNARSIRFTEFRISEFQPSLIPSILNFSISKGAMAGWILRRREVAGQMAIQGTGVSSICWLGRIVPRKRLDLFLDASALAIGEGIELRLTIVGGVGFVPGYEKMIEAFPFRDRLTWKRAISRQEVPSLLNAHDVLVQPSDEEDFGSSVAEAQACGLPVIVGHTNGNQDYLCSRDIRLTDDRPETLAAALREMSSRKVQDRWGDPATSRRCAQHYFSLENVTTALSEILERAAAK